MFPSQGSARRIAVDVVSMDTGTAATRRDMFVELAVMWNVTRSKRTNGTLSGNVRHNEPLIVGVGLSVQGCLSGADRIYWKNKCSGFVRGYAVTAFNE